MNKQPLTQWMRTVLADYVSGYRLKDIAKRHYVSHKEVLRTTRRIKERLGCEHLAQAALVAYSLGYITLPDENGVCFPASPWENTEL